MKRLKGITFVTFLCSFLLMACSREEWGSTSDMQLSEAVFKLYDVKYGTADLSRAESLEESRYDRLEFYIVDDNGERIKDVKGKYNATTSEILVEGLHEGDYRLLV